MNRTEPVADDLLREAEAVARDAVRAGAHVNCALVLCGDGVTRTVLVEDGRWHERMRRSAEEWDTVRRVCIEHLRYDVADDCDCDCPRWHALSEGVFLTLDDRDGTRTGRFFYVEGKNTHRRLSARWFPVVYDSMRLGWQVVVPDDWQP